MIEAPIPFGNAASRWFYVLLRELVARGHRVTAFAACTKVEEIEMARKLFPSPDWDLRLYPPRTYRGLASKFGTVLKPYSYMFSRDLRKDLEKTLVEGYDIFHLEQIWSGWLGLSRPRTVLNALNLYRIDLKDAPIQGSGDWLRRKLLLAAEKRLTGSYPNLITLSDRLRDALHGLHQNANIYVVPLGIDYSLYPYIEDTRRAKEPVVSVIGNMKWQPTYSATVRLVRRLWPEIKRRTPTARLQIVGWGARTALKDYINLPDLIVAENVLDTRPYFEQASLLLYAPPLGSGMKVKILESFAYGVPVVTNSEGVEGLPVVDGLHAGVCQDDEGLIDRAVNLLNDREAQNRQRAAARDLLVSHCGPGPTVDAVERVYSNILKLPGVKS